MGPRRVSGGRAERFRAARSERCPCAGEADARKPSPVARGRPPPRVGPAPKAATLSLRRGGSGSSGCTAPFWSPGKPPAFGG